MRKLIRIVGLLGALIIVLLLVVLVVGLLLPEEHHVSRTLVTKQTPQAIWDTINDHSNEHEWRHDIESVISLGERNGKPVSRENYKDGNKVALITTEFNAPTRMVRELTDLEGPFSGRWEIDIQPTPTAVTSKSLRLERYRTRSSASFQNTSSVTLTSWKDISRGWQANSANNRNLRSSL